MKPTYLGLLLLLWSACGGAEMPDKNTQNAVALISQGATVIDVRTPIEIADGALPGALSIIHTDIVAGVQALALPSDAPLVLYCRSGIVRVWQQQRYKLKATLRSLMAVATSS